MRPNRNALAPRNDPQEDDAQEDAVDTRSKTRRKRDAEALSAPDKPAAKGAHEAEPDEEEAEEAPTRGALPKPAPPKLDHQTMMVAGEAAAKTPAAK